MILQGIQVFRTDSPNDSIDRSGFGRDGDSVLKFKRKAALRRAGHVEERLVPLQDHLKPISSQKRGGKEFSVYHTSSPLSIEWYSRILGGLVLFQGPAEGKVLGVSRRWCLPK